MFSDLPDPRAANAHHSLSDIIMIALAASLCGGQCATDYAQFARSKQALLTELIGPFDPPSHDTFSRVFRVLDPDAFAVCFSKFAQAFGKTMSKMHTRTSGQCTGVIAIDGKAMRRAYERGGSAWPPIIVSAWASDTRLVLGALKAGKAGQGEAATAIRLIGLLDLGGATVTADALHCHRRMAAAIQARAGDYVLALKGNQSGLQREALQLLAADNGSGDIWASEELSHGRLEKRTARIINAEDMAKRHKFAGIKAIIEITSQRNDNVPYTRLFLSSKMMSAQEALAIVRAHWAVENNLHWCLDVILDEDQTRARLDNAPANTAQLKRIAMSLLNQIDDKGTSIRRRVKKCAWEEDYLLNTIRHMR